MYRFLIKSPRSRNCQLGMTLIEVLISMLLTGLLLVAMSSLWVAVGRQFDDLTLRQKAVFRINGEMERLVQFYRKSNGPDVTVVSDYGDADIIPPEIGSYISNMPTNRVKDPTRLAEARRLIYSLPQTITTFPVVNKASFETPINRVSGISNMAQVLSNIYYYEGDGDPRNFVWIDQERSIVAQLSWDLMPLPVSSSGVVKKCGLGSSSTCNLLTVYLDFPFRYISGTIHNPRSSMGPVDTITLQTIVGRIE